MKKLITLLFIGFSLSLFAQTTKKINVEKSVLDWKGYKIAGHHEGTIKFSDGALTYRDSELVGGYFVVDMATIECTDLSKGGRERLERHLKDKDFFDVESHPYTMLNFLNIKTNANGTYTVIGELEIKGIKQKITFDFKVSDNTATTSFQIDRTKFDIKYRSESLFPELADRAIKDNFDISVNLVF